jgi:dUTP pyrophosphatase
MNGLYQVSNLGRIKSLDRSFKRKGDMQFQVKGKIKKQCETGKRKGKQGYLCTIMINKDNVSKAEYIHILVAKAFIPNPENKPTVNHIDGNKHNNCVNNLEWNSYSENNKHAIRTGLREKFVGFLKGYKPKKIRKFEKVEAFKGNNFSLPQRSTRNSAGFDFTNPVRVEIPPYKLGDNPTMVRTGVKVKMPENEFLMLVNRSSNPKKKKLVIPNSMGIIDADYYNNPDNEGEMFFGFYNVSNETVVIEAGEKLGQGIFIKYGITEDDNATGERKGGFGSTGK